ncbi:NDP-sugar epimerase, includes UDP-GlcNAc-inverting 4,6-dehydratase FlaA1 and capsular polysaccharide biosynthesis protein EpsC [Caldanaerobius fijiensis DSM 17918]|uniref:NDP-sugar epimerase, includes UDP-GlcNAc-inverting 4,6-dehydratase FlaA1 and capsular polysaccharide biosynthesis protein EpsC n=1 Tax=Caldanaerobius fijiensis DSM 17918 TaxID=1121256 RepID=A0A1M5CBB3_9THEO|nr:nucleoside-diphosphate sugar epimerase/dehydratase [Caldanaerobius fijiensis]SHF52015.1 NDP-sugar epimerase, includes UDP-GlcNAc-inverting 4,6-dehydratase FlaA1 and capsular polysaccharide biosynthesis protein EpsC [Caldanaerobius fijiensis DSM 17918]
MWRNKRKVSLLIIDTLLLNIAYFFSFYLRFDYNIPYQYFIVYEKSFYLVTLISIVTFIFFKQYNKIWRYANLRDIMELMVVTTISSGMSSLVLFLLEIHLPRSIYPLYWFLSIILITSSRILYGNYMNYNNNSLKNVAHKKVLIIGAGSAGRMLIRELKNHPEIGMKPVAILDDDKSKLYRSIDGIPVMGKIDDIQDIINEKEINEVIFAIPSAPKSLLKKVIDKCSEIHIKVKTLPGIYELVDGTVSVNNIRDVDINDLLRREPVKVNLDEMSSYIKDKKVMITGGGGSIGSELCRQVARFSPSHLIILDIYENNMYDVQQELKRKYPNLNMSCIIASIRDEKRISNIFKKYKPDIVFHAAAHKHVPLMEDNPQEAIKNNVYGTLNLVKYADLHNVKKFVMISTDKAVNPTSIMGATKRICEMIIQSFDKKSNTEFVAVRFGNVLGSNGSVIPLFKKQIAEGGPVTVTHEEVKRYFMTIPEAVQLVIQAGALAKGGEIFVLDMGEPVKIIDLARDLIRLSGFEPDVDIPIIITGLRPGEKLFEELLLSEDKYASTKHDKIFIEKPVFDDYDGLMLLLEKYRTTIDDMNVDQVKAFIKRLVPEYNPSHVKTIEEIAATEDILGDATNDV